jgi:hypothetical protein
MLGFVSYYLEMRFPLDGRLLCNFSIFSRLITSFVRPILSSESVKCHVDIGDIGMNNGRCLDSAPLFELVRLTSSSTWRRGVVACFHALYDLLGGESINKYFFSSRSVLTLDVRRDFV